VPVSTVHATLRNRLYSGEFEWNGRLYQGKHQPLVTRDLWERVQGVLDGRNAKKHRRVKHGFALFGPDLLRSLRVFDRRRDQEALKGQT
jgi:site-specific DNA recombinase